MDGLANTVLREVFRNIVGTLPIRTLPATWRPGRILLRTPRGEVIEITARQLAPHDPDAVELASTLAAIDAGDVE